MKPSLRLSILLFLMPLVLSSQEPEDERFSTVTTSLDDSLPREASLDDFFYPGLLDLADDAIEDDAEDESDGEAEDESEDEMEEDPDAEEDPEMEDESEDSGESEDQWPAPIRVKSLPLDPGYYRIRLSSFCLQSGRYRPAEGDGYLLAPLKGPRADIIANVLLRVQEHPRMDLSYVQSFLWAVESDVPFQEIDEEVQSAVGVLLTAEEKQALRTSILPAERASRTKRAAVLRWMGKRAVRERALVGRSYADRFKLLEQALVPIRPDRPQTSVPAGAWTALGQGTYARFFPDGYSEVEVEIYRPGPRNVRLSRDALGRLSKLESGETIIQISYQNDGEDVQLGEELVRIHRFKEIRYTDTRSGQSRAAALEGYVFDSAPFYKTVFGTSERRPARPRGLLDIFLPDDVKADYKRAKDHASKVKEIYKEYERTHGTPPPQDAVKDLLDVDRYKKGLETAKNPLDFGGRTEWARNHAKIVADAFGQVLGILGSKDDGAKRAPGLAGKAVIPGANGSQRLGLSGPAR